MTRAIAMLLAGGVLACGPQEGAETGEDAATDTARVGAPGAADTPPPTAGARVALTVDTLADAGAYLADAEGRALYLFTADSRGAGESTCYDACAEAWPPLVTGGGAASAAAPAVRSDLIGTLQRRDGSSQVTYNGWPLYYYREDTGPGTATGQDVHEFGGEWYLVTPEGEQLEGEGGGS